MTKEQFERLAKHEQALKWAALQNFIHMSAGEFGEMAAIYADLYKEQLTVAQSSCNACRLKALKRMYGDYVAKQEEIAAREAKKAEKEAEKAAKDKKGAGRPNKINLNAE